MPGQYRKKFNILPASTASQALQNPGKHHRTRQSTKKNLANAPADLKKNEIENEKKMMGLQRFLLYKLFLSSKCDRKIGKLWKRF